MPQYLKYSFADLLQGLKDRMTGFFCNIAPKMIIFRGYFTAYIEYLAIYLRILAW